MNTEGHTMSAKPAHRARTRKFYIMSNDYRRGGSLGLELENLAVLMPGQRIFSPPTGRRGFTDFPEMPRFRHDKKQGRPPRDLDEYEGYWLVSNRAKAVLQSVDPEGFAFAPCEVWLAEGPTNPPYWLCDVVRVLEAVDEKTSRVTIEYDEATNTKYCRARGDGSVVIKEDVVGPAHVFRLAYGEAWIFCDQELKDACKAAGVKGIWFTEELRI
jgi:hypothetical protein